MPNYAQAYAQCLADAVLLACCDGTRPEDKERLLIDIIQIGIDHYGLIRNGHPGWPAHGGHGSGRKFPIVFAGAMLGDEAMANINKTFPKAQFGEDEQTAYGDCWTGAKVVFTGHSGIDEVTGIGRDFVRAGNPWGPYEHLPPDQWVPEEFRSDAYRRANTSTCFVAQALVLRTMKLEKAWNHDAFFDYVDRWMFEDDKPFRIEIAKYCQPALQQGRLPRRQQGLVPRGLCRPTLGQATVDQVPPALPRSDRRLEAEARRQLLPQRRRKAAEEVGVGLH